MPRALIALASVQQQARERFRETLRVLQQERPGLELIVDSERLLLAAESIEQLPIGEGRGVILGRIANASASAPGTGMPEDTARMIYYSRGEALIRSCWGGYLAFLISRSGEIEIIRAPLGDL